jgi:hypothetical protein
MVGESVKEKFSGFWLWKKEMDKHEMWPRMSKTLASRQLETRNEQSTEPIRTTATQESAGQRRTFVPASLRTNRTGT